MTLPQSVDVTESWFGLVETKIVDGKFRLIYKSKEAFEAIEQCKEDNPDGII